MAGVDSNWAISSAIFQQKPYRLIVVGAEGNVGTCDL